MKKMNCVNLQYLLIGVFGTLIICFFLFMILLKSNIFESRWNRTSSMEKDTVKSPSINNSEGSIISDSPVVDNAPNIDLVEKDSPTSQPTNPISFPTTSPLEVFSEPQLIQYLEQDINQIEAYASQEFSFQEKIKNTFVSLVDFLFYDGEIKGCKFKDLTDLAKLKIITLTLKLDYEIDQKFPSYKDHIKGEYMTIKGKIAVLYIQITQSICENVGEDTCNQAKEDFESMKNSFDFVWSFLKELGMTGKEKLSNFYLNWRDL